MADEDLDATRIRELLLDFYAENDPQRLNMGLDIFSMVVWTQQNGLASLNDLLMEQYGAKIDPKKQLGGAQASFKRFSALMNTDTEDDTQKRNHIYNKLVAFYEEKDPSKIGRLNDFVQYIMLHGIDAFNRKLMAKYGEGITLDPSVGNAIGKSTRFNSSRQSLGSAFTISTVESRSTAYNTAKSSVSEAPSETSSATRARKPPALPPKKKKSPTRSKEEEPVEDDVPPPPPPPESGSPRDSLREKLRGFYAEHDPSKLDHLESIIEWGMQIGEEELEGKLIQIYGAGFKTKLVEKKKKGGEGSRFSLQSFRVRNSMASVSSKASKASNQSSGKPHPPPSPKARAPKNKTPKNPIALVQAQAGFSQNTSSGRPNTMARQAASPDDGPCSYYELDMTGSSFGVCKCGYSRLAHMKGSPENKKATAKAKNKARQLASEMQSRRFLPGKSGGALPLGMEPKEHTGTYLYMTTSQSKQKPAKIDASANGGEKGGKPCGNFRLDMTAGGFSVCECGFKRDQHSRSGKTKGKGLRSSMKRLSKQLLGR